MMYCENLKEAFELAKRFGVNEKATRCKTEIANGWVLIASFELSYIGFNGYEYAVFTESDFV